MIHRPSRRKFGAGALGLGLGAAFPALAQQADAMSVGAANAPLQLTEFASTTCPHCDHFHETNWTTLKANYIDTGRVRVTMQEMLTPPPIVALGMFQLARCGNADGVAYFHRLGILFERREAILATGTMSGVLEALVALGAEWGFTREQVMAALNDGPSRERVNRSIAVADSLGITSTPAFVLNGQRLGPEFQTPDGMRRILDAALAG
jgi:protein-disulfide isomerase